MLQQIEGQLAEHDGREEAQAEVEGPQSAGGTQGQGGWPLAAGRGVQGLQCFLVLLGRQVQTSGARAGTFWYILFSTCYD